jgi:hypothetical protein
VTYYFMPRVPGLASEVTLVNRPPRESDDAWRGRQIVHAAWTDGQRWRVRALGDIAPEADIEIGEAQLPRDCPEDALPVLFLSPARRDGEHARLPAVDHMETVPAWRANIRLRSATTAVSYQGEYPSGMAAADGSLLSIAPLIQCGDGIATSLLFINIWMQPAVETHRLRVLSAATQRMVQSADIRSNRCSVIALGAGDDRDRLRIVACAGMTGVPIYFSHDAGFTQMSLEHSHPPVEMVAFGARGAVNRAMKSAWSAMLVP